MPMMSFKYVFLLDSLLFMYVNVWRQFLASFETAVSLVQIVEQSTPKCFASTKQFSVFSKQK